MYFRVILSLLEAPGMHKGGFILGEQYAADNKKCLT